ncbi:MAG: hypothetical protein Q3988_01465 [Gemella sp.]|nr:hypothetical protein [Gemella sp.]
MKEILVAFRKTIIVLLVGLSLILLIPTIYSSFNQADLNNITDRKYKRENSQYLITSISKDDYYYFDFYQDKNGTVWLDDYRKKSGEVDYGRPIEFLVHPGLPRVKPEHIRVEWDRGKLENGYEYDIAYLIIEIDGKTYSWVPFRYYTK